MKFDVSIEVNESGRKRPEYTLETDLNGEVSLIDFLQFTKQSLILTADEVVRDEQQRGFDRDPVVIVDGRPGKPVFQVSPLGSLEFVSRVDIMALILEAYEGILLRSPILTGRYKSSNFVFLNGQQVATDLASLQAWTQRVNVDQRDVVRFVNVQPYARKLERMGVTGQRTKSRTVTSKKKGVARQRFFQPNGTYFLTARSLQNKYRRNAVIQFTFISGSQLGISGNFKTGHGGKPGRQYLYPSIVIASRENGVL
jgi:hypothetical protein